MLKKHFLFDNQLFIYGAEQTYLHTPTEDLAQYLSVAFETNSSTYGSFLNLSVPTAT